MGILKSMGKGVVFFIKPCVNVKAWFGYDGVKAQTKNLTVLVKSVFQARKMDVEVRDFDAVLKEKNISEDELLRRSKMYYRRAAFYVLLGVLGLFYVFYMFWTRHLYGGFLALLVSGLIFSQAYANHLFYFQIKHRKLGCTFKEWFNNKTEEVLP